MTDERSYRLEAIAPPAPVDEETLDALRQVLAADSRVSEGWIVGSRMTRDDGDVRETTDVAVAFDPTLVDGDARVVAFTALMAELEARGQGRGTGRTWLIATPDFLAAGHGTRFYARPAAA